MATNLEQASIAILIACHNRKARTLKCLSCLSRQAGYTEENTFILDDGSTDGTSEAVRKQYPAVNIIKGTGSLFWNGGMRAAWKAAKAAPRPFDYYLWLNDDVELYEGTIEMLVNELRESTTISGPGIITAATIEPSLNLVNYSAQVRVDPKRRPLRLQIIQPNGHVQKAETISGNIVLVSKQAEEILGNFSPKYIHIYGDLDYGLRASKAGIPVLLASRLGGACDSNSIRGSSMDWTLSRRKRLQLRWKEDKRVHAKDWITFVKGHANGGYLRTLAYRLSPYFRIIVKKQHGHALPLIYEDAKKSSTI